jgi:hypothetical protein
MAFKTVFKRIGGRVIPIRESLSGAPSELQKVMHVKRAREFLTKEATQVGDRYSAVFYRNAVRDSKIVGQKIGMRIAKLARIAGKLPK